MCIGFDCEKGRRRLKRTKSGAWHRATKRNARHRAKSKHCRIKLMNAKVEIEKKKKKKKKKKRQKRQNSTELHANFVCFIPLFAPYLVEYFVVMPTISVSKAVLWRDLELPDSFSKKI